MVPRVQILPIVTFQNLRQAHGSAKQSLSTAQSIIGHKHALKDSLQQYVALSLLFRLARIALREEEGSRSRHALSPDFACNKFPEPRGYIPLSKAVR